MLVVPSGSFESDLKHGLETSLEPEANSERGQEGEAAFVLSFSKERLAGDGIEADAVVDFGRVLPSEDVIASR